MPQGTGPRATAIILEQNQSREDFSSPGGPPRPHTASTASDGHTYNPVPTGIHRAAIADSALQFWSGKFPALMRTRVKTPDTYVYSAAAAESNVLILA
jgi:hypothetical protein